MKNTIFQKGKEPLYEGTQDGYYHQTGSAYGGLFQDPFRRSEDALPDIDQFLPRGMCGQKNETFHYVALKGIYIFENSPFYVAFTIKRVVYEPNAYARYESSHIYSCSFNTDSRK